MVFFPGVISTFYSLVSQKRSKPWVMRLNQFVSVFTMDLSELKMVPHHILHCGCPDVHITAITRAAVYWF